MKKVNFKKVLITVSAVFALLFIGVAADAQTVTTSGNGTSGTVNFLGSDEAKTVLLDEIADLKNNAQSLLPGSPAYVAIQKTGLYYHGIYQELVNGKSVTDAVATGLGFVNNASTSALSEAEKMTLLQGAIDLLQ